MYHPQTDTSYFLVGYTIENFDYDAVFDNIEYLLQDFILGKISNELEELPPF